MRVDIRRLLDDAMRVDIRRLLDDAMTPLVRWTAPCPLVRQGASASLCVAASPDRPFAECAISPGIEDRQCGLSGRSAE